MAMNGCVEFTINVSQSMNIDEIPNKIHLLTEYYRFHNEIPRMFMIPESDIMNK